MDARLILSADAGTPDAGNKSWVEVLVTTNGEVVKNGRSQFVLDQADLETCAAQIRENGDKLPLDYDHSYVEGGSTVASGWFTGQTQVLAKGDVRPNASGTPATEDELWAQVEWTPQAAEDIRSKRFRFISAEFLFAQLVKGVKRTVKEFAAATLTNRPFFNRMEAVTLSRVTLADVVWDATAGFQHIRDRLAAALEDEQSDQTYVVPFTIDENGDPASAPVDEWVEAEEQWVAAAKAASDSYTGREATTERVDMDTTVLAKSLGLAETATDDEITAAVTAAKQNADRVTELETQVEALKGEKTDVEALRDELKVERTKRITGERASIFSEAIREGQMAPAEQEALEEAFGENVEALKKVLDARPKNATLAREKGTGGDGPDGDVEVTHVKDEFASDQGFEVDEDSAALHAKTLQILGKDKYDEDEYIAAYAKAQRGETVTA